MIPLCSVGVSWNHCWGLCWKDMPKWLRIILQDIYLSLLFDTLLLYPYPYPAFRIIFIESVRFIFAILWSSTIYTFCRFIPKCLAVRNQFNWVYFNQKYIWKCQKIWSKRKHCKKQNFILPDSEYMSTCILDFCE